jgi:hypothetical protein
MIIELWIHLRPLAEWLSALLLSVLAVDVLLPRRLRGRRAGWPPER